jgi:nucleoid DNA-binding protein
MAKTKSATKGKALTKAQIYQELADKTGVAKKEVGAVLDALNELIRGEVSKKAPGQITLPGGLIKIKRAEKKATKARKGRNLRTGEEIDIPAKPKRTVVKAYTMKALRDMFAS